MSRFLKERVSELRNITWPTKKQAIHTMVVVLTIMLLVGVFLTGLDRIIASSFSYLIGGTENPTSSVEIINPTSEVINLEDIQAETADGESITVTTTEEDGTIVVSEEVPSEENSEEITEPSSEQ